MSETQARMLDVSGASLDSPRAWQPVRVPRETIEREIERLAAGPLPANGRRAALIVHPSAQAPGLGFAPGVDITINVLKPGEATTPMRRNANQIEICIRGRGTVHAGQTRVTLDKWDVCTIPSMRTYAHRNESDDLWVRLTYSNTPLLDKLGVHYFEQGVAADADGPAHADTEADPRYSRETAPDIPVGVDGARLRGYEFLTDIQVVPNRPLHWPWQEVSQHLTREPGDGRRSILLLYNPATERRNGTTHSFFATMSWLPPGSPLRAPRRGHRHTSVAINYHFAGSGRSEVDGQTIAWRAGDLLLSAPGWSEHAHFQSEEGLGILTVQDHPLHIGMESLIWQERMDGPILTLGSEQGQTGYVGPREAGA